MIIKKKGFLNTLFINNKIDQIIFYRDRVKNKLNRKRSKKTVGGDDNQDVFSREQVFSPVKWTRRVFDQDVLKLTALPSHAQ